MEKKREKNITFFQPQPPTHKTPTKDKNDFIKLLSQTDNVNEIQSIPYQKRFSKFSKYPYRSNSYPQRSLKQQRQHQKSKNRTYYKKKRLVCSNCDGRGHVFKQCKKPIQSNGIVIVKINPNKQGDERLQYLLIERKNSIAYEAFVRAKFKHDELHIHVKRMTSEEKKRIKDLYLDKNRDILDLYDEVCYQRNGRALHRERKKAQDLYSTLNFKQLFNNITSEFDSPGWEFPKGRSLVAESHMDCAIREVEEETNLSLNEYTLLDWEFQEVFKGTNKKIYLNKYFVAVANEIVPDLYVDPNNINQITEIRNIGWFTFQQAENLIRPYHHEKINMLREINIAANEYFQNLLQIVRKRPLR